MGQLASKAANTQMQAAKPAKNIQDIIKGQWPKIEAVMPKHMSSERLYQLTISAINHEPKLAQCDITTLLSCVMKCSSLGLEPSAVDGLGRAYILPFNNRKRRIMEATFILGYKGMLELARRSGQIKDISARAVYEGDYFEFEFGLDEKLAHRPAHKKREAGEKPTHVYMIAHFTDGGHYMDVMTFEEIEAIRARSKAKDYGPWATDYEAMAKKTVIRRAFPYLPVSIEAQEAASTDESSAGYFKSDTRAIIEPEIFEVEPEAEAEPEVVADTEPKGLKKAVCKVCGNVADTASDATLEDLASLPCCETPKYEWME